MKDRSEDVEPKTNPLFDFLSNFFSMFHKVLTSSMLRAIALAILILGVTAAIVATQVCAAPIVVATTMAVSATAAICFGFFTMLKAHSEHNAHNNGPAVGPKFGFP